MYNNQQQQQQHSSKNTSYITFLNTTLLYIFIIIFNINHTNAQKHCTVSDLFTDTGGVRFRKPLTDIPTNCISFEGTGAVETNGYDSLLGILTDIMTVEEIVLNYALLGDNGASDFADWYKINKDAGTLSNLERISLQLNDISDVGVIALAKALCSTGTGCDTSPVKELSLHTNDIGYGGAQAVANLIAGTDKGLEIINLGENHIGESGGTALGVALKDNTYLKRLILYADPLGVNNTKSISDAMIEGNFASGIISNLYVIGNNINDNGLVAIADALKANTVLTHLDIGKNVIKDPGALLLYAALSNQVGNANSAVEVLGLQWNYITNVGANLIAKLLTENNKIKCLDLHANRIEYNGTKTIANALMHNTALKYLDISSNLLTQAEIYDLKQYFKTTATNLDYVFLDTTDLGTYSCMKLKYCDIDDTRLNDICNNKNITEYHNDVIGWRR